MTDIERGDLLRRLGYASDHELLLAHLESAGLTNARKARIAASKTGAVAAELTKAFLKACTRGDCKERGRVAAKGRTLVQATAPSHCDVCGGSAASSALRTMQEACAKVGWTRICVVGGSPNARREIESTETAPIEFRLVEGTKARTKKAAAANLAWADLVVIWGGTHSIQSLSLDAVRASPSNGPSSVEGKLVMTPTNNGGTTPLSRLGGPSGSPPGPGSDSGDTQKPESCEGASPSLRCQAMDHDRLVEVGHGMRGFVYQANGLTIHREVAPAILLLGIGSRLRQGCDTKLRLRPPAMLITQASLA